MSLYRLLVRIPLVGTILYIANCYVFGGDREAVYRFAPLQSWFKVLLAPFVISLILTSAILWPMIKGFALNHELTTRNLSAFAKTPGDLIVSVVPSLLGFGIGVYALIFALAGPIVRDLQNKIEELRDAGHKTQGSALVINSDLAYPLTVLVVVLSLGVFQKNFESKELIIVSWTAFWYALVVTFEVIGVLFGLGDHSLLEKLQATHTEDALSNTRNDQPLK
ncbi:hypothetical protein [Burkholderia gladioli]|uniref:hypothetical protein n=1 Tax=Burkholderia gladioli TaxID=28095 RepID=UPI00163F9810|nr:hypothetical protein [Burkholderia gladioli]